METNLTETRIRAMTGAGFWRDESLERGSIISCQLPNWKVVEVENLLYTHPRTGGVAIVGIPDPRLGERALVSDFPTTPSGKIQKYRRRELVAERIAAGGGRGG
jgi:hypothetical protein